MDIQIWIGILISILPIFELRGGLPIVIEYSIRNGVSIWPYFFIVLALNILVIVFVFMFLDFIHNKFMKWKWYEIRMGCILKKIQIKADKVKSKMDKWGYLALIFFVAIPFPGTGAWTGCLIAWMMKLDRLKSFIAIATGITISGLIILFISLGIFNSLY